MGSRKDCLRDSWKERKKERSRRKGNGGRWKEDKSSPDRPEREKVKRNWFAVFSAEHKQKNGPLSPHAVTVRSRGWEQTSARDRFLFLVVFRQSRFGGSCFFLSFFQSEVNSLLQIDCLAGRKSETFPILHLLFSRVSLLSFPSSARCPHCFPLPKYLFFLFSLFLSACVLPDKKGSVRSNQRTTD